MTIKSFVEELLSFAQRIKCLKKVCESFLNLSLAYAELCIGNAFVSTWGQNNS